MDLLESTNDEAMYLNRGALEESLQNTTKLLESLDKNNRFEDVGEYNYLLTGMEGLIGQFSENHYELHHEIKEIMESSRMGLLTHEKLVEMVTAEQLRSQYLSNIVGSLKDQIENLFTTILSAVDTRNGGDPEDLIDKVSNNVNLMWKSVESMSKVISSPSKRLDQTIRKIDSEVVVHLSKSVQNNEERKESFADKLDRRLHKAKVNDEKRRHRKAKESDSDSESVSEYQDRSGRRTTKKPPDDIATGGTPSKDAATSPINRHLDSRHTDSHGKVGKSPTHKSFHPVAASSTTTDGSSASAIRDGPKSIGQQQEGEFPHINPMKMNNNLVFDDNSSLGAASLADSEDSAGVAADLQDDDSMTRANESGKSMHQHHRKHRHHHKKSRKERRSLDGEKGRSIDNNTNSMADDASVERISSRTSRRPSFDEMSETSASITKPNRGRGSGGKRTTSEIAPSTIPSSSSAGIAAQSSSIPIRDNFTARLEEERRKWEKERLEWQKAFEARQLVEVQRTIYRTVIPILEMHKVNTTEYQQVLQSLTSETNSLQLVRLASQLSIKQQEQFGTHTELSLSSFRAQDTDFSLKSDLMTSTRGDVIVSELSSRPLTSEIFPSSPMPQTLLVESDHSLQEFAQYWTNMDADQRGLLLTLSSSILNSGNNDSNPFGSSTFLQQISSVIDQERLVQFLQEQLSHFSGEELQLNSRGPASPSNVNASLRHRPGSRPQSSSRSPKAGWRSNSGDEDDVVSIDSKGKERRRRRTSSPSNKSHKHNSKKQGTTLSSKHNADDSRGRSSSKKLVGNTTSGLKAHLGTSTTGPGLTVQGKKTQKPMTQFLEEQAYHIGQLVKAHMQREGIFDATYYAVVTEFIQQSLANAVKSHGDSGLKLGNTAELTKQLQWIKISLPDKFQPDGGGKADMGVNTDFSMVQNLTGSSSNGMGVKGNGLLTTTMVKTTTTVINGTPMQQQQLQQQQFGATVANVPAESAGAAASGWELPIYDNQDNILITRTYRPPAKKEEFLALLQQHSDPLMFIFEEFQSYLSKQDRLKLYFTCLNSQQRIEEMKTHDHNVHAPDRWQKTVDLVHALLRSVLLLDDETKAMSVIMLDLEAIIQEAVGIVKVARRQGAMRNLHGSTMGPDVSGGPPGSPGPGQGSWRGASGPNNDSLPDFDDDLAEEDTGGKRTTAAGAGNLKVSAYSLKQKFTIDDQNIRLMESHLFDIQRILGELEARVLSANLQQLEYRAFFQTMQASGSLELPSMLKEFTEVQQAFTISQEIQGRLYEVQQRLLLSQDRCHRYALFQYLPPQFAAPLIAHQQQFAAWYSSASPPYQPTGNGGTGTSRKSNSGDRYAAAENLLTMMNIHVNQHDPHIAPFLRIINDLQEDMQALEEEKEDLELEMLELIKSKDRTPDAILFFSLMHDPSFVSNLQQLCLQMKQIRGFLDYSVHMDYVMLRKRLQVCMVLSPTIEKLVEKYGLMYKQWSHFRRNWFAERNLRGGSAEAFTTCPLCYHSLVEGNTNVNAGKDTVDKAHDKRKTRKALIQAVSAAAGKMNSPSTALHSSKQHGHAAAAAAVRQDDAMLAAPSNKLAMNGNMGGGTLSSASSVNSNGSRRVSHSISLPSIAPQR